MCASRALALIVFAVSGALMVALCAVLINAGADPATLLFAYVFMDALRTGWRVGGEP